jgi:hypothetical protein
MIEDFDNYCYINSYDVIKTEYLNGIDKIYIRIIKDNEFKFTENILKKNNKIITCFYKNNIYDNFEKIKNYI